MFVVGGSSSRSLSTEVARILGAPHAQAATSRFPDGECYTRVDAPLGGEDAVIIQNTYPDGNLVEMLLIQDAVKRAGPRSVTLVVPYFGYARQDRVFKPGEPESAGAMAAHLGMACDRIVTVDIHKEEVLGRFGCPGRDLKAAAAIADHFRGGGVDLVLAPDIGAAGRARDVGDRLGVPHDHLEKTRLSGSEVRIAPAKMDCAGKRILIVDDMISTGGTIIAARGALAAAGAESVSAACTHGVFAPGALERLQGSLDGIACCDTIEGAASTISAAPLIAAALREEW
ncbi:MAG: ribose-phosphate diphosphokinase [Candidatus Methanoplasma sp.]|jgi:ribose-phosphate pyrophosphokinase|nr:ribose-phosphate diphosphokinase [Candidatus Methanoplasma sp.]